MILESKLKIPDEEIHIIEKPEFKKLFDDTAPPCTIVKAMPGFGKTAVCARAAKRQRENVRWYTLDMTDNDEKCFLIYMEEIWKTVDGKAADSEEAIRLRVLGLARRAQQWDRRKTIHIVLDNLQVISSGKVLQILSLLQQYVEGWVSFVLITNQALPPFFLPILARGKGWVLSSKHLQLTSKEVCCHFGGDGGLAEEVLKQITKDLCGWPFGIQCVAGYLRSEGQCGGLEWNRILQESFLSGYLDDILERNCTKQMQSILKQVAIFDEFSWEMCQSIFTEQITRREFEEMLSGLVFFYKMPGKDNIWRCGKSFQVYLCQMLSGSEKRELCRRAALWYQERKDFASLYRALFRLEDDPEKLNAVLELNEDRQGGVLKICCFGTFRVTALRDGKEFTWRTRKGRELFAYLLDRKGKAVERRQLLEVLWQDEVPENAVAMLHNMIYNIRKELSAYSLETILTYENKRYSLNMDRISCDIWNIQQITALVEKKDAITLKKEYKSFLKYWGSYLGDIDSVWVEGKRVYYDEIYKRGCWILAGQFAEESNYETALVLYKNILMLEPYSEEVVEKILVLYGQQRKWEKLKKCYQDFAEMLEKDLGIAPGEEVFAAYHRYL